MQITNQQLLNMATALREVFTWPFPTEIGWRLAKIAQDVEALSAPYNLQVAKLRSDHQRTRIDDHGNEGTYFPKAAQLASELEVLAQLTVKFEPAHTFDLATLTAAWVAHQVAQGNAAPENVLPPHVTFGLLPILLPPETGAAP